MELWMRVDREEIERFVRGELGCGCPEDVFQRITLGERDAGPGTPGFSRLVVGERLLIYVLGAVHQPGISAAVSALATHGMAERDGAGYNRFRLVTVVEPGSPEAAAVTAAFQKAVAGDSRTFLHCLGAASVPSSLIPPGPGVRAETTG
jgi:hypothetical protein